MAKNRSYYFFDDDNDWDAPSHRRRGKGRGRGRGALGGRGRGAYDGSPRDEGASRGSSRGGIAARGGARGTSYPAGLTTYHAMDEIDVDIQQWHESGSGYNSPRGRGGKRSNASRGSTPPSGGRSSPFRNRGGRGRGQKISGRGSRSKLRQGASLSDLLYQERPLLRPIIFVRSEHTATLFEQAEDLLEPVGQSASADKEHVPTANQISRVFSGGRPSSPNDSQTDEEIEEVDFEDLGRIRELVEGETKMEAQQSHVAEVEKKMEDFHIDPQPSITSQDQDPVGTNGEADGIYPEGSVKSPIVVDDTPIFGMNGFRDHNVPLSKTPVQESSIGNEKTPLTIEGPIYVENGITGAGTPAESVDSPSNEEGAGLSLKPGQGQDNDISYTDRQSLSDILANDATTVGKPEDQLPGTFYVDTLPTRHDPDPGEQISFDAVGSSVPLGVQLDDEDDIIVYEAPNPRSTRATPAFQPSALPQPTVTLTDILFKSPPKPSVSRQTNPLRRGTLFEKVSRKGKGKAVRKKLAGHSSFAAFGAIVAEARLRQNDDDPRKDERRHGDSDIDWGDDDADGEDEVNPRAVAEGMDLDPDLVGAGVSTDTMKRFVNGVSGEGSQFVTMDDLNDIQKIKDEEGSDMEDESNDEVDDDVDDLIVEEEMILAGGSSSEDEEDEEDSDDDLYSPRTGFQARLDKLRRREEMEGDDIDDIDSEGEDVNFKWVKQSTDGYIHDVEEFLDANNARIKNKNKKIHNMVFHAIQDGYLDEATPVSASSKDQDIPVELREQWKKDRLKQSEKKKERQLARMMASLDSESSQKGGKKSRKAMIRAAKLDPSIEIPNRIVDMVSVEQQIRRFLGNKNRTTMALPPADKGTRKNMHMLAHAFNLKSKSKDGGGGRYTTLIKNKYSGIGIDEKMIAGIMKGVKTRLSGKGPRQGSLITREGDVVGHAAPKIDESNIGFRMLASMGWVSGDTIGLSSKGLEAPVAAVIKKTKLGLGATKSDA